MSAGDPSARYQTGRIVNPDVSSEKNCKLANEWMRTYNKNYSDCRAQKEPVLPTRVLDISVGDHFPNSRLLIFHGQSARYPCLSYCWGPGAQPISLTLPKPPKPTSLMFRRLFCYSPNDVVSANTAMLFANFYYIFIGQPRILSEIYGWSPTGVGLSHLASSFIFLVLCAILVLIGIRRCYGPWLVQWGKIFKFEADARH